MSVERMLSVLSSWLRRILWKSNATWTGKHSKYFSKAITLVIHFLGWQNWWWFIDIMSDDASGILASVPSQRNPTAQRKHAAHISSGISICVASPAVRSTLLFFTAVWSVGRSALLFEEHSLVSPATSARRFISNCRRAAQYTSPTRVAEMSSGTHKICNYIIIIIICSALQFYAHTLPLHKGELFAAKMHPPAVCLILLQGMLSLIQIICDILYQCF